jgi:hypothetical protein
LYYIAKRIKVGGNMPNPVDMKALFDRARDGGKIQYLYTLLRIRGVERRKDAFDQFLELKKEPDSGKRNSGITELLKINQDFISELWNLCQNAQGQDYVPFPFENYRDSAQEAAKAFEALAARLKELGFEEYADQALATSRVMGGSVADTDFAGAFSLLTSLTDEYKKRLEEFKKEKGTLFKIMFFEVVELLINEDGLYGLKHHFSNGNSAFYERTSEGTNGANVLLMGNQVNFNAGLLSDLKHEWRIGDKKLYEVGLPGRYNNSGEWKPLVFPGNPDHIRSITTAASTEYDIQGCLLYMLCTGHRLIEFTVYANLDSPYDRSVLGERMDLDKCGKDPDNENFFVYDGTFRLDVGSVEEIRAALNAIEHGINRIAFSFNCQATWKLKYSGVDSRPGCSQPSSDEMEHFNELLKRFPQTEAENAVLEDAIDWYSKGVKQKNHLNEFLSYYVAIEQIAFAVFDGDADFGLDPQRKTKAERAADRDACIRELHDTLYVEDPAKFVREAYSKCIHGNKQKVLALLKLIFGESSPYLAWITDGDQNVQPLNQIRNDIAHGSLAAWKKEDITVVEKALPRIEQICRHLIIRLILNLKPEEPLPDAATKRTMSIVVKMDDPRGTSLVTRLDMLPEQDWKIKAAWVRD